MPATVEGPWGQLLSLLPPRLPAPSQCLSLSPPASSVITVPLPSTCPALAPHGLFSNLITSAPPVCGLGSDSLLRDWGDLMGSGHLFLPTLSLSRLLVAVLGSESSSDPLVSSEKGGWTEPVGKMQTSPLPPKQQRLWKGLFLWMASW